jgi:hypothetical protein
MGRNKPRHHIIPARYLKGFCEPGTSFVWVFRRGEEYKPGGKKGRDNPYRSGLKETASERNRNTIINPDGIKDSKIFESAFQKIETKSDDVFDKIRTRKPLTFDDKEKLARYIGLMIKRVNKRNETIERLIDKQLLSSELDSVVRKLADQGHFSFAHNWLKSIEYLRSPDGRKHLRIRTTVVPFNIVHNAIIKMMWKFIVSPEGKYFITSDNPVIYDTHFGLKRSPLFFPIDLRTALIATWHDERDLEYIDGSMEQLLKINGIILAKATKEIYAHTSDQWIHQAFENGVVISANV